MEVTDEEMPSSSQGEGPIVIAAAKTARLDLKSRRVRWCIALALLIVFGSIGGVVYAAVAKTSRNPTTLPFTPLPPIPPTVAPTSAPVPLVWQQVGQNLVEEGDPPITAGPRGELYFGWAVDLSSDGFRLATTSPFFSAVYIYDLINGTWRQTGEIIDDNGDFVDHIALSGDGRVLTVGMPGSDDAFLYGGKVQVYESLSGSWQKRGIPIYGMGEGDRIGGFIDDDWFENANHTRDEVFSTQSYDSSSLALSHNGSIFALGSSVGNYVQVFHYDDDAMDWHLFGNNNVFVGENTTDKFGTSVDLSSDGLRILVGAPNNIGMADAFFDICNGHVRAFHYVEEFNGWIQLGSDIDGDKGEEYAGAQLGSSVSISEDGSTISVAANLQASSEDIYALGDSDGYVKVYRFDERIADWAQVGNTIVFQFGQLVVGLNSEKFPIVARLSGDGNRLALSVMAESLTDVLGRGVVRLYALKGEVWEVVTDPIEGTGPFDDSGRSIALSFDGSRLAIGSPRHNVDGPDDGEVRVFDLVAETEDIPSSLPTPAPSSAPAPDQPSVPITFFLAVDEWSDGSLWSVKCDGEILLNTTTPSSPTNVTETVLVPDRGLCQLQCGYEDILWHEIHYGNDIASSPVIVKGAKPTRDIVTFVASPSTTSVTVFIQYDAHPEEISWRLSCGRG